MNLMEALLAAKIVRSSGGGADLSVIAAEFSAAASYAKGNYCIKDGKLYRAKQDIAAGTAWSDALWDEVTVGGELEGKLSASGVYDDLTAGNARNLVATGGVGEGVPFALRTTGGTLDVNETVRRKKLVGGTVRWNQLCPSKAENWNTISQNVAQFTFSGTTATLKSLSDTSTTKYAKKNVIEGHVFLVDGYVRSTTAFTSRFGFFTSTNGTAKICDNNADQTTEKHGSFLYKTASGDWFGIRLANSAAAGATATYRNLCLFDLTAMFGSTIADAILAMGDTNGVSWFRRLFPKPYYAYNAGTLMSAKPAALRAVGFNAWGASSARVVGGMQYQISGTWEDPLVDDEEVTVDEDGYFTAPRSGTLMLEDYDQTTCVHLVWDGERDGTFEAYVEHVYSFGESPPELRGLWKLDANGVLFFDGDEYAPDGTISRKYAQRAYASGDDSLADAITDGTNTVYKLTTPTTEQAAAWDEVQTVDDFGTEEFIDAGVTAATPTRDVAIPVGHLSEYLPNLRAKLEMAPELPTADGTYAMQISSGLASYVMVPKELPPLPTTDGNYYLAVYVSDGTVTMDWEPV